RLIGYPYKSTLIGSASVPEVFTADTKAFDCVTYVETVLALAHSENRSQFRDALKGIRYESGKVDWKRRNHYMTQWLRNNIRDEWVKPVPGLKSTVTKRRL